MDGIYTCVAENRAGKIDRNYTHKYGEHMCAYRCVYAGVVTDDVAISFSSKSCVLMQHKGWQVY